MKVNVKKSKLEKLLAQMMQSSFCHIKAFKEFCRWEEQGQDKKFIEKIRSDIKKLASTPDAVRMECEFRDTFEKVYKRELCNTRGDLEK